MNWKFDSLTRWLRPFTAPRSRPHRRPRASRPRRTYRPEIDSILEDRVLPSIATHLSLSAPSETTYGNSVTVSAGLSADDNTSPTETVGITCDGALAGYVTVNDPNSSTSLTLFMTAGNHSFGATFPGDGDYDPSSTGASVLVDPAALYVAGLAVNDKPYDGTTTAVLSFNGVTLNGVIGADNVYLDTTHASATFATANAGSNIPASVTGLALTGADAGNYVLTPPDDLGGNITPIDATINVTPYDVTYNGSAQTAGGTATGVGGVDLSSLLDLSGTTHTNAGPFPSDGWTFTDPNGNYNSASGTIADQIDKANATVSVTPYDVVYDGTAHTAQGTALGPNDEDLSSLLDLSGTTNTNAGSYPGDAWSFTDPNGNYNSQSGTVADQIDKADAIINVNPYDVTYDGNDHTADGTAAGVNGENLNNLLDVEGTSHGTPGSYTGDSWTFVGNANYNAAAGTVDDDIGKADASITVTPYTVTYDGYVHTATGSATGVDAEDLTSLLDLSGTDNTNPGTYSSDQWFFAGNDLYNSAGGTVTDAIARANASITITPYDVTYDGNSHAADGTATGINGEDLGDLLTLAPGHTDAGDYSSDAWTFAGNPYYNADSGTIADRIAKADATITITPYGVPYDGASHTAAGTAFGVGGEDLSGLLDLSATTHTGVGDYAADPWTFAGNPDYNAASGTIDDRIAVVGNPSNVSLSLDRSVIEVGDTVTLSGSFTDPDTQDPHVVTIDWGDGPSPTVIQLDGNTLSFNATHQYLTDPTITVAVTDPNGAAATGSIGVSVNQYAIAVTAPAGNASGTEGTGRSFALGSFTDDDPDNSSWTVTVDWGDGSSPTSFPTDHSGDLGSQRHTYAGAGSYTASVQVSDDDGDTGQASFPITIMAGPLTTNTPSIRAIEGTVFTGAVASFSDPNPAATTGDFWARIDWGDGNSSDGIISPDGYGSFLISGTNTYTDEGTYPISVSIGDQDGSAGSADSTARVADAVLVASADPNITATQGQLLSGPLTTFTDPNPSATVGDFTATIDWGDGSPIDSGTVTANGDGTFTVSGAHTYAEESTYALAVTITDVGGSTLGVGGTAVVNATVLTITPLPITAVEGQPFSDLTVATFTDSNPQASDFTATIDWGDGSTTTGTVLAGNYGGFLVTGDHAYAEEGSYAVAIAITDGSGVTAGAGSTATVTPVGLTVFTLPINASEGQSFDDVPVATFTDSNFPTSADGFTATITWGDGQVSFGTIEYEGAGTFTVLGSNTYADEGSYAFRVQVVDPTGISAAAGGTALVGDAPLMSSATEVAAVEGQSFSAVVASFTDDNPEATVSDFRATIAWDDGHVSAGAIGTDGSGTFTVTGANTYADEGDYSITVTIMDLGGQSTQTTSSASVLEAALTASGVALTGMEGQTVTAMVAQLNDANPETGAGDFATVSIDWGDGQPAISGTVVADGNGVFDVIGSHSYPSAGYYPITVTVTDLAGSTTTASSSATITDAPLLASGTTLSTDDGAAVSGGVAEFTDANPLAPVSDFQAVIDWGDGTQSIGVISAAGNGTFTVSGSNLYPANGSYAITVTISDAGGSSAVAGSTAQVGSSVLTAGGTTLTTEEDTALGGVVVASFTTADAEADASSFTASIDWGNGQATSGTIAADGLGGFWVIGDQPAAYADEGCYAIRVTIIDASGNTAAAGSTAQVIDAALTPGASPIRPVEGQSFSGVVASFTDSDVTTPPSDFTATIAWGDGHVSAGTITGGNGVYTVSGTNTYPDEGSYLASVTVADVGGQVVETESSVTVTDAPLTGSGVTLAGLEGMAFTGVAAQFTDANPLAPASEFTAAIDWGDGQPPTSGTVVADGSGLFDVIGSYTYAEAGAHSFTVTIGDVGGSSTTATSSALISDVGLTASGSDVTAPAALAFTDQEVATFTDTNPFATADDFTALIDWGDGQPASAGTILADSNGFHVTGSHQYNQEGSYAIAVTITDNEGSHAAAGSTARISALDLAVSAFDIPTAVEGQVFTGPVGAFSASNHPQAPAGDYAALIRWGDGATSTGTITGTNGNFTVSGSHRYTEEGSYPLGVTIFDAAGNAVAAGATATVASAVLTMTGNDLSATEGQVLDGVLGSFSVADRQSVAGDFTAIIHWGDGQQSAGTITGAAGSFTVSGSHTYAEEGSYALGIDIVPTYGDPAGAGSTVQVADAALQATARSVQSIAQQPSGWLLLATFTDLGGPETLADYDATVDWGDGTTADPVTRIVPAPGSTSKFQVLGSHSHAQSGAYSVTVTIHHENGIQVTVTGMATVAAADSSSGKDGDGDGDSNGDGQHGGPNDDQRPTDLAGDGVAVPEGVAIDVVLATFTTAAGNNTPDEYTATIDWGDDSEGDASGTITYDATSGRYQVWGSHTYEDEGSYPIAVTVSDDDGNEADLNLAASVAESDSLSGEGATGLTADTCTVFSGTVATFTDHTYPDAPASDFIVTIDWGDTGAGADDDDCCCAGGGSDTATLTANGNGTFTVSGSHAYHQKGDYTITVTVTEDDPGSAAAVTTTTIKVTEGTCDEGDDCNDSPMVEANDDAYSTLRRHTLTVSAADGILANDNWSTGDSGDANAGDGCGCGCGDEDNSTTTTGPYIHLLTTTQDGELTLNADGSFVYVPDPNFAGQDFFTYYLTMITTTNSDSNSDSDDSPGDSDPDDPGSPGDPGSPEVLTSDIATVTIDVYNHRPMPVKQSVVTEEDTPITITVHATDEENDPLTYIIFRAPQNGTVTLNGDQATYTPDDGFLGADEFTFEAFDGLLWSNLGVVRVGVTHTGTPDDPVPDEPPPDQPPTVTVGPSQVVRVGDAATFQATIDGPDGPGDITLVQWDFNYDGSNFDANVVTGGLSGSHVYDAPNIYDVAVQVTDSDGNTAFNVTSVLVVDANALIAQAGADQNVTPGSMVAFSGSYSDPSGSVSSSGIAWDMNYDGQDFNPTVSGTLTPSHAFPTAGTYQVAMQVTDDQGNSDFSELTVTVGNQDTSPPPDDGSGSGNGSSNPGQLTVNAGADQSITVGDAVTFNGSFNDPGGQPDQDAVEWDFNYDGVVFQPSGATDLNPTHTFVGPGIYTVALQVTDAEGDTEISTLEVDVTDEPTLVVDAGPDQEVDEGETVHFDGRAIDLGDEDPWGASQAAHIVPSSAEWDFNYDGSDFQPDPSAIGTFTPSHDFGPGTYLVAFQLTDNEDVTQIGTLYVTVDNVAPEVHLASDQSISKGDSATFTANVTDPGGPQDITQVQWDFDYDGVAFNPDSSADGSRTASHQYGTPGTYTVAVVATDASGDEGMDTVTVTVQDVPPQGSVSNSSPAAEGSPVNFTVHHLPDVDPTDTLTYWANWGDGADVGGSSEFEEISSDDLTSNADGSVGFAHVYDDNGNHSAIIRIMDAEGKYTDYPTDVTVTNVAPTADFGAGEADSALFSNVTDPSQADTEAGFTYYFSINGSPFTNYNSDEFFLPANAPGGSYTVRGYVEDKDGGASPVYTTTLTIASDVHVQNLGSGSVQLVWDGGPVRLDVGPNQSVDLGQGVTGLRATLKTPGASYDLRSNGSFDRINADPAVTAVELTVHTDLIAGLDAFFGDGHVGEIDLPGGDGHGGVSTLSVYDRGDLGSIVGPTGSGARDSNALDLFFANLTGSITGLDHIGDLHASGSLGSSTSQRVQAQFGIDRIEASGIGAAVTVAADPSAPAIGTQVAVGLAGVTGTLDFGNQPAVLSETNALGQVVSVSDPLSNSSQISYDANGYIHSITDPLGHTRTFQYSADGRLLQETAPDGQIDVRSYDANGLLIGETLYAADGTTVLDTRSYLYDANGNLLTASNNAGTYALSYDDQGRVQTETDTNGITLTYGYDTFGNVGSIQDSLGGAQNSTYDSAGHLLSRTFTAPGQAPLRIDFSYTPDGKPATVTRYSDLAGTQLIGSALYTYDGNGNVIELQDRDAAGNVVADYGYAYDAAGRVIAQTINGTPTNYQYDASGQLISDGATNYSYDANGNRTMSGYVTGAGNELLSDGTWNYSYDDAGNLAGKVNLATGQTWTYHYDLFGRMTSAEQRAADGTLLMQATYLYDVFGKRIEKDVWSADTGTPMVTRFAYAGAQIWGDLDGNGDLQTRYLRGDQLDQLFAAADASGAVSQYLTDPLGSVRDIIGPDGQDSPVSYDAFGNPTGGTAVAGRYGWTGREFDAETGLYHSIFGRNYDAQAGRWNSPDLLGFQAGDSNLYRYLKNNPRNGTDPTGMANIFGVNLVPPWDANASWNIRDNLQAYGQIAANAFQEIQVAGQTILARVVEDIRTSFDTLKWVVDKAGQQLLVLGDKVVHNVAEPVARAFAAQLNQWQRPIADLIAKLQAFGAKADAVLSAIVHNPTGFASNLLAGLKQGVQAFTSNLGTYLPQALFQWLFKGTQGGGGAPDLSSPSSIVSFFLGKMGLTWDHILDKLVAQIGPDNIALISQGYDLLQQAIDRGVPGVVQFLQDKVNLTVDQIKQMIIQAGVDYLTSPKFLGAVSAKVAAFFVPGAAVLTTIYNMCVWVFDQANTLVNVAQTVVNGIDNISQGDVSGFASSVTVALKRTLVPVLDFFASWVPGLKEARNGVVEAINFVHNTIDRGITTAFVTFGGTIASAVAKINQIAEAAVPGHMGDYNGLVGAVVHWHVGDESHRIWDTVVNQVASGWMASGRKPRADEIKALKKEADKKNINLGDTYSQALTLDKTSTNLDTQLVQQAARKDKANARGQVAALAKQLKQTEKQLADLIKSMQLAVAALTGDKFDLAAANQPLKPLTVRLDAKTSAARTTNFALLANRRRELGLAPAGSPQDDATVARLVIAGKGFIGVNAGYQDPKAVITFPINGQSKKHAEAQAAQEALNAGMKGSANRADLYVDRPPCGQCDPSWKLSGIRSIAKALGVQYLFLHVPGYAPALVTPFK